jgi:hypothetical protein
MAISKVMGNIRNIKDVSKKQEVLWNIYNKVDILLETYKSNKKLLRIFELLQLEISKEILK